MAPTSHPDIRYGQIDPTYEQVLSSTPPDDDGPVWMVNLMRYRPLADYADGRETTLTGREADDLYTPLEALAAVGAEIVFAADVDTQLLGDPPPWDRVAVVKYPTRRAFADMQDLDVFRERHVHKDAGMEQTIIIGTQPMALPAFPADLPDWSEVPHPPTDDDPYVVVMHVLRFNEGGADTDMVSYQDVAGSVAVPHGLRIGGWFTAEGTIVGDGRAWEQVRFNVFPSRAAFMAVALDPRRMEAHTAHREPAIADTYALILRPLLDRLAESTGS